MKYQLMLRSRPDLEETITRKHDRFIRALARIKGDWGLPAGNRPKVREPGPKDEFVIAVKLTGCLGKGIAGAISYQIRQGLVYYRQHYGEHYIDQGKYDDYIQLEFDPYKVDYQALVGNAFLKYVAAFRPYQGKIEDEDFIPLDFEAWRKLPPRGGVHRISPVNYFDRELCRRAFRLTPEEVVSRLLGQAERASVESDGAFILASSRIRTLPEADDINRTLKPLLTGKTVPATRGLQPAASSARGRTPGKRASSASKKRGPRADSARSKGRRSMTSLARAVIDAMQFLELSDDDTVDPHDALKTLESMTADLQKSTSEEKAALRQALKELTAAEKRTYARPEVLEFYAEFMEAVGLQETEE
jgi:hypothetical protein